MKINSKKERSIMKIIVKNSSIMKLLKKIDNENKFVNKF